jgi:hypothetical protein
MWILAKLVEEPTEGTGGGVATSEEGGNELISKEFAIGIGGCQCMKQSVLVITSRQLLKLILGYSESGVDIFVDEVVEYLEMLVELFARVEKRQTTGVD